MKRLILVRHGKSMGNLNWDNYKQPDSAVCLCEQGVRQVIRCGDLLKELGFFHNSFLGPLAFSAEYTRAIQTGRIILDKMGLFHIQPKLVRALNERNYGICPERPLESIDPYEHNPEGESSYDIRQRVANWIDTECLPILSETDVYVFAHFGSIRAAIAHITNRSNHEMMEIKIKNAQPYVFEFLHYVKGVGPSFWKEIPVPQIDLD